MKRGKRIVLATHGTLGDLHPFLGVALENNIGGKSKPKGSSFAP
jgi:hypothetical protein